jgi:hypothetical protein
MTPFRVRACLAIVPVLLAACTSAPDAPDAHVPPFARVPYEPISRDAIVAIALREWRLFGSRVDGQPTSTEASQAKPEREPGLWQRVGEYWWLGLDAGTSESKWTGKHDEKGAVFPPDRDNDYPWSAAFVSYVMRIAGAGRRFPYAPDHAHYIDIAKLQTLQKESRWLIEAERPEDYAPHPGDLVCRGRDDASNLRYDDLPAGKYFPAHCDIVVDTSTELRIDVVGGNEHDAVTMKHVTVATDGKLAEPDGRTPDPGGPWLVVLRLDGVPNSSETSPEVLNLR